MVQTVHCVCGARLEGETGELLLAAVERHAAAAHVEPNWRWGPTLDDLRRRLAAFDRRIDTVERALDEAGRKS